MTEPQTRTTKSRVGSSSLSLRGSVEDANGADDPSAETNAIPKAKSGSSSSHRASNTTVIDEAKMNKKSRRVSTQSTRSQDKHNGGESGETESVAENLFAHALTIRAKHVEALELRKLSVHQQQQLQQQQQMHNKESRNSSAEHNNARSNIIDAKGAGGTSSKVQGTASSSFQNSSESFVNEKENENENFDTASDGDIDEDLMTRLSKRRKQDAHAREKNRNRILRRGGGSPEHDSKSDASNDPRENDRSRSLEGPKYSYLRPEHLLRHEQAAHEERLRKKKERQHLEQIRLRNLAIARERELHEKNKSYEDTMTHFANATVQSARDGPDPPIHSLNVTTTLDERLKHRHWFPSGRHGGRNSKHKPPLGYGSLPLPSWSGGYSGTNTSSLAGRSSALSSPNGMRTLTSASKKESGGDAKEDRYGYDSVRTSAALAALGYDLSDEDQYSVEKGGGSPTAIGTRMSLTTPSLERNRRGGSPSSSLFASRTSLSPGVGGARSHSVQGHAHSTAMHSTNNSTSIHKNGKAPTISPLKPFREEVFEDITKEKVARREQLEHEEKWAHIRLIQQKRAESVHKIEEQKRKRQLEIEEQLKQDVVAAQADKDRKKALDQQFAYEMRNLDRARREKIAAYKEERAKAVLKNALEMRMEALRKAEDQERYDRQVKKEERSAADAQRTAHLLALQEERDKHEARLAHEAKLRAEFESRTREYNFQQEQRRLAERQAKLGRVDRQIEDKLRYRQHEADLAAEKLYESEHLYSTLLKVKKPFVIESRAGLGNSSSNSSYANYARDNSNSSGNNNNNGIIGVGGENRKESSAIDRLIAQTDHENEELRKFYRVKA